MTEQKYQPKNEISRGTLLSVLFNTQLEHDKQLLTLSSSAIALLVTLLRTVGVSNLLQIVLFGIALIAFLVTVILMLITLRKNADYIQKMLNDGGLIPENKYVYLGQIATGTFIIGIIMVVIIGMYSAKTSLSKTVLFELLPNSLLKHIL